MTLCVISRIALRCIRATRYNTYDWDVGTGIDPHSVSEAEVET